MRLFIATGIFHPESGGPATYLHGLLPEAIAAGHDVRLLTFGDPTPADGEYGYPVQRVPRGGMARRPLAYAAYLRASRPLLQWADLTYIHSTGLPLWPDRSRPRVIKVVGDTAWERCIRRGWIPPTEDIDAFQTQEYGPSATGAVVAAVKALRARAVRPMDRVIVPSEYLKRMVVGWGVSPERVQVIYNALSPAAVAARTALSQQKARAALDLPPDAPLLLTVARITWWKGIGPLIRALENVPEVRLLVAGDGPALPDVQRVAETSPARGRVTFLGRLPREQVAQYMRAADYTALYSGYEGLSHTLLESLHARTPVIASDKGGNPEVVRHEENGLLVPYDPTGGPAAVAHLTGAIRAAFAPGTRDRLAARAGDGMARFTWDRMVGETLAALAALIKG